MRFGRVTGAVIVALGLSASLAVAGSITQTQDFSGTPNLVRSLTFDQFDDGGGSLILQSIKVIVSLDVDGGQYILDNDGDQPASGTLSFGAKGDISSGDVSLLNSSLQPVTSELEATHSGSFNLAAQDGDGTYDYDPTPPDGLQYDGGVESDSTSGFISPTVFGQYTGAGTYDIDVTVDQWQDFGGISGIEWAVTPVSASGAVTVIYNYIVVPEPATLALAALAGLLVIRRRHR